MTPREALDAELDQPQARLMNKVDDCPNEALAVVLDEFVSEADFIRFNAGRENRTHAQTRIQCMLRDAGLIPGDDEPCSS